MGTEDETLPDSQFLARPRGDALLFERIFKNSLDAMVLADDEGRYQAVNNAACVLLGYSREQLLGMRVADLQSCEGPDTASRYAAYRQHGVEIGEFHFLRGGREACIAEYYAIRLGQDENLSVMRDQTARKRMEAQLRESEARFRALIESALDGIAVLDGASIVFANRKMMELLGVTALDEVLGSLLLDQVHPADQALFAEALAESSQGAEHTPRRRLRILGGRAGLIEVELTLVRIQYSGRPALMAVLHVLSDPMQACLVSAAEEREQATRMQSDATLQELQLEGALLRLLSKQVVEAQEREQRHIARELHDEIGQLLTTLSLRLSHCMQEATEALSPLLTEVQVLTRELLGRVREVSLALRPPMLDELGLLPALTWNLERIRRLRQIHIELAHIGVDRRFPPELEITIYRVVQEALTNIVRHTSAREAMVRLWANTTTLSVQIVDRGQGFDPQSIPESSAGLLGMRERVLLLGGHFTLESAIGLGTTITVTLPLQENRDGGCRPECLSPSS